MRIVLLCLSCCILPGCVGLITYSPSFSDCQYVSYERRDAHVMLHAECELPR